MTYGKQDIAAEMVAPNVNGLFGVLFSFKLGSKWTVKNQTEESLRREMYSKPTEHIKMNDPLVDN